MTARELTVSILDRANRIVGDTPAHTLRTIVERAQRLDTLGYRRLWVAEHHGVPGIAGSAPSVLMAAIASTTTRIRVGSGGIMLPSHQPLVAAEHIATLEALFPGRIDIALGRSLGFTPAVRRALRQPDDADDRFEAELGEMLAYLAGTAPITMQPTAERATPLFVLAHGASLEVAARFGLGVVVGGPGITGRPPHSQHDGLEQYRRAFTPSPWCAEPTVIIAASVAVADRAEQARDLLVPEAWSLAHSRTSGSFDPLLPIADIDLDAANARERERLAANLERAVWGTPSEVASRLQGLISGTGATELLATGGMSDPAGRARSDALLAEIASGVRLA